MSFTATDSVPVSKTPIDDLVETLSTSNLKKQLQVVPELSELGANGLSALVEFVRDGLAVGALTSAHGSAYQVLFESEDEVASAFVREEMPDGLMTPRSEQEVDYAELQMLLVKRDYQAADKLTTQKLCELAGERAMQRKWVYFTEVAQFSVTDLQTIDQLWRLYSEDKFGWSKQHELWMRLGQDWERLWSQLIWKSDEGKWTRYPGEFIWDLSAPVGHLPLSNQLRGVRMIDSLLSHPAWK